MWSPFLWYVTLRHWMVSYQPLDKRYWSRLQESKCPVPWRLEHQVVSKRREPIIQWRNVTSQKNGSEFWSSHSGVAKDSGFLENVTPYRLVNNYSRCELTLKMMASRSFCASVTAGRHGVRTQENSIEEFFFSLSLSTWSFPSLTFRCVAESC